MNKSVPTIATHDLVTSNKQTRFLQELKEHLEDSGDAGHLGDTKELIETFNMYATPGRNLRIALIITIALLSFSTVYVISHGQLYDNNFPENYVSGTTPLESVFGPLGGIVMLIGAVFYLPVIFLVLMPLYAILTVFKVDPSGAISFDIFAVYFFLSPYIACMFWTSLTTCFCFSPKDIFPGLKR